MIKSHCRGGVLGRNGWEGRSLQLSMTQTEKWGGGSENAALMWLEFQGLNIIFRAALFPFTLIGAERTQAFFTFLQHLTCHLIYMLEITNSTGQERTQDVEER